MPKKGKKTPTELKLPAELEKTHEINQKLDQTLEKIDKESINVRVVEDVDMAACFLTALYALIILVVSSAILVIKTESPRFSLIVGLILCWGFIVLVWKRMQVYVDARMAKAYLNNLFSREMVVYLQGFHFVPIYFSEQPDDIDFQKQTKVWAKEESDNAPVFMSADGWEVRAEWSGLIRRRNDRDSLSHSLNYPDDIIEHWLRIIMDACLADFGAEYPYEFLKAHKEAVIASIRRIFAGESGMADLGKRLGYDIELQLISINLANPADRESKAGMGRADILRKQAKKFKKAFPGLSDKEAADSALITEELVKKSIIQFDGLPPGGVSALVSDVSKLMDQGGKK